MGGLGGLLSQILKVLSDPGSNLLGAMLLLSMLVLVLLILAVAALVTILPGGDDEGDGEEPGLVGGEGEAGQQAALDSGRAEEARKRRPHRLPPSDKTGLLMLMPVLLLAVGVVWGWQAAGAPGQCAACHASAGAARAWSKGDHREVACTACHEDGVLGLPAAITARLANGVEALQGMQSVEHRRAVPADRCLRCHDAVRSGTLTSRTIKVRHSDFLAAGYDCRRCHEGVGHSQADAPERAVDMNQCVSCHDGKRAKAECSVCHVGDTSSAIRVSRSIYPVVDITPRPGCTGCHETTTCLECHRIVMPHPKGFGEARAHARLAAFERKDEVCYRCHTQQDCKACHRGDFTTHGADADWKRRHPSGLPLDGRDVCACHTSKDFCGICHDTSAKR